MIYSFLGWICEVVYCSIPAKKIVNRGFLAGPYCPIYGFGALIILFLLHPFMENPPLLFVFAVIATTLLEYVTSWAMEALFGIRWWDYSNEKLNLNGRICLKNSLIFGVLSVIIAYLVHPLTSQLVMGIGSEYKRVIASLLVAAVAIDLITTLNALYKLDERLKKLKALLETAEKYNAEYTWFDKRDLQGSFLRLEEICAKTGDSLLLETTQKIRGLTMRENPGRRFLAAFPNMKHRAFEERLSGFMARFKDRSDKVHESIWKVSKRWAGITTRKACSGVKSFASGLNFYKLFWVFFISSVICYIVETIFCFVTQGYSGSLQGLIYGPFSQIYGFGAVIIKLYLYS